MELPMNVITCASYYGTGSSAITDLISEFKTVHSLTDYEFRFAHDPDGLSELEFNLVENFNRHNSGHAIKRYKRLVDYYSGNLLTKRYEPFFQHQWKKLSYEYIDSLVDFSYPGNWQFDYYDRGRIFEFFAKLPNRILQRTLWRNGSEKFFNVLKNEVTYASYLNEKNFLEKTRAYTDALLKTGNTEGKPFLMVDQIVPSSNIQRHLRYFNNTKVIVVDRDPRDLYLLGKYVWSDPIIPKDIDLFCKWYTYARITREEEEWDNETILLVQFEDLIFNYEETQAKVIAWCGLNPLDHVNPRSAFDPSVSIKNTRLWENHPKFKEEAERIAAILPQALYEPLDSQNKTP